MNQQQQPSYQQELGLKKLLYKYQNQNQQLKSQIRALNQRLNLILSPPVSTLPIPSINPIAQYQGRLLKQQMQKLFLELNKQTIQMKINKDSVDQRHQLKCKDINDRIIKEDKEFKQLQYKFDRYERIDQGVRLGGNLNQLLANNNIVNPNNTIGNGNTNISPMQFNNITLRSSTLRIQNHNLRFNTLLQSTQTCRRSIKQLQLLRDQNDRNLLKKHTQQVDTFQGLRNFNKQQEIQEQKIRKKGVWGLENTKENYQKVREEMDKLKEKEKGLQMIRNQNQVLVNKVRQLQGELDGLHKSIDIPPLPFQKRQLKIPIDLSISTKLESPSLMLRKSARLQMLPYQFQANNDKNFAPKKSRQVVWQSSSKSKSGIQWKDSHLKSPITGLNLWFQPILVGIQLLHESGISSQHLLTTKKLSPIQYRLSNDYLQNIILYINDNLICGIELISKNGRNDVFGNKTKGKKYDMGIRKGERPVVSMGVVRANGNISQVVRLGFQVV